jgi:nucleotide sugar dehydrogenase
MPVRLVVVGMGYVGLPLARESVRAGYQVVGLDIDDRIVEGLNAGLSHVDDLDEAGIRVMLEAGFRATSDPSILADADVAVICVPTPLGTEGAPDLTAVASAVTLVAEHVHPGMLVVLESTTYPGTTEEFVQPLLERTGLRVGEDIALAFSPERIDPGNQQYGVRNTPKVVGGVTSACAQRAVEFYTGIVDTVVRARGTREAEMAKLLENTYRHVNIALVNEMARFCHELSVDLGDVIRCAETKPFGFQAFYPGPGVGGHCIPIDPNYLSHRVKSKLGYPFRFVELAQEINLSMPGYVARRLQDELNVRGKAVNGAEILLLGVTYKPDIADERESPARPLVRHLQALGAQVSFHDPLVDKWTVDDQIFASAPDLDEAVLAADMTVLVQNHSCYDLQHLTRNARCLFDTRGVVRLTGVPHL